MATQKPKDYGVISHVTEICNSYKLQAKIGIHDQGTFVNVNEARLGS